MRRFLYIGGFEGNALEEAQELDLNSPGIPLVGVSPQFSFSGHSFKLEHELRKVALEYDIALVDQIKTEPDHRVYSRDVENISRRLLSFLAPHSSDINGGDKPIRAYTNAGSKKTDGFPLFFHESWDLSLFECTNPTVATLSLAAITDVSRSNAEVLSTFPLMGEGVRL